MDVEATPAGVATTTDTGSVAGSAINVGLAGSLAAINGSVFVQSTGGTNALTIDDSAAATAGTYTIASEKVTATTMPGSINFSGGGLTTFNLNSSGNSTVTLASLVQSDVTTYHFTGGTTIGPNTLNLTSPSSTPDYTTTPGVITFGAGDPTVDYTTFATVNITKPAIPPTGTGVTITATAGQALNNVVVANFTLDPNDLANTSTNFVASINWGDGTPATAGTIVANGTGGYNIQGSHTYATTGAFTIDVTLTNNSTSGTTTVSGTTINVTSNGPVNSTPNPIVSTANTAAAPLRAQGATVSGTEGVPLTGVLVATFTDTGTPGTPSDYTATIDWGDGTTNAATSITSQGTPNGVVFSVFGTHTYATTGTFPLTVTITKTASGATAIGSGQAVIATTAVGTITPGTATAFSVNTGVPLAVGSVIGTFTDSNTSAPASDFTAVIDWGDGSPTSIGTVVAGTTAGSFNVEATHTYAKSGSYTPTILLTQAGGPTTTLASPATATITVTDLAVTGSTKNFTAVEGINTGAFVLATFTDPNMLATVADVTASLPVGGWGDGTPTSATGPGSLVVQEIGVTPLTSSTNPGAPIFEVLGSHTYTTATAAGTPDALSVVITTLGGATTTLTSPAGGGVTVQDAPLTSSNGTVITGIEGSPTTGPAAGTLLGTFTDANQGATVTEFTTAPGSVVVNWGDGSANQTLTASNLTANGSPDGVVFSINASHTYAEEGTYAYTVTVTDSGGSVTMISGSAVIADAPLNTTGLTQPTVTTTASTVFPIPEFGAPVFTGLVATFNDTNPTAPISDYKVTIDWGDGTAQSAGTVTQPGGVGTAFDVTGSHTYADAGSTGTYPITVYIQDVGGSALTVTNTAHVTDNPIVLTGSVNLATVSGQSTGTLDATNNNQPDFTGTSQAFSWVTLTATPTGGTPMVIGTTQAQGNGAWNIASTVALPENTYAITATAVNQFNDSASMVSTVITPKLEIDKTGPVITAVSFDRLDATLTVTYQDNLSGMDLASLGNSAFYHLKGKQLVYNVHVPSVILVTGITITPGATPTDPVVVTVVFHHGKELRGGLYMIDINSGSGNKGIEDNATNAMSGTYYGVFPTGDGRPGGDFKAWIETYHKIVKPFVPVPAGYVPPSASVIDPPVAPKSSGHAHRHAKKPVRAARAILDQVGSRPVVHALAPHVSKGQRTSAVLLDTSTNATSPTSYLAMEALDTHDAALDQLGNKTHRS